MFYKIIIRYGLLIFLLTFGISACKQKASTQSSKEGTVSPAPMDSTTLGWDRPGMMKDGYQIPIYFEEEFKDALAAAKFEMGTLSHGIWFWDRDGKFYNLEGKEHIWE